MLTYLKNTSLKMLEVKVKGLYKDFTDINVIHKFIVGKIEDKTTYSFQEMEKAKLKEKLKDDDMTLIEHRSIKKKIDVLDRLTNSEEILADYLWDTKDIVDKFNATEDEEEKRYLFSLFLDKTKKYIRNDLVKMNEDTDVCNICGQGKCTVNDRGNFFCDHCNNEQVMLIRNLYSYNTDFNNSKASTDEENFITIMKRFQGKNVLPNPTIVKNLEEYLKSFRDLDPETVRNKPLNKWGKKDGTSKADIRKAMKVLGYESEYKDINLYANVLWGWTLPDISEYEEDALTLFRKTNSNYNISKGKRKSFINGEFRLMLYLLYLGYEISPEDFKLAETTDILEHNLTVFNKMLVLSGYKPLDFKYT